MKKSEALKELCNIISASTGELLNSEKISNTFASVRHEKISQEARRYDLRGRREIGALRKYYFCDTGLRNARLNFAFPDEGQMLENIVYNELIYNGYAEQVLK